MSKENELRKQIVDITRALVAEYVVGCYKHFPSLDWGSVSEERKEAFVSHVSEVIVNGYFSDLNNYDVWDYAVQRWLAEQKYKFEFVDFMNKQLKTNPLWEDMRGPEFLANIARVEFGRKLFSED